MYQKDDRIILTGHALITSSLVPPITFKEYIKVGSHYKISGIYWYKILYQNTGSLTGPKNTKLK
jgi:hypothetical protein